MKKFYYSAIILSFISINALAGDSKGYGGDIIRCSEANSYHNTPLDYYELYEKFNWKIPSEISEQEDDELSIVTHVLETFKKVDYHRYLKLKKNLETFYTDVRWVNTALANVDDAGEYHLPPNCQLIQIINQNQRILRGNKKYLVRNDLWKLITPLSKAVLILHELLYLETNKESSETIRELVARAFSNRIDDLSTNEYFDFLQEAKFKTFTKSRAQLHLNSNLVFYDDGEIKSGKGVEDSKLYFKKDIFILSHNIVEFYKNGNIKTFCARKGLKLNIFHKTLNTSCANQFGHYQPTKLYKDGNIKESSIPKATVKLKNQTYSFGNINQSGHYYSLVNYNKNNSIQSLKHTKLSYEISGQKNISFSAYHPIKFRSSQLYVATIDKRQELITNKNTIFIEGETFFSNHYLESSYLAVQAKLKIGKNIIIAKENTKINFHKNMNIKSLTLSTKHILFKKDGTKITYEKDSQLTLDRDGNIL